MTRARSGATAAIAAVALGLLLALTDHGTPSSGGPAPAASAPSWAEAVERGADHIAAADLVALLDADPARVCLVDTRPEEEFAAFRIKNSVNLSLPRLLGPEGAALLASRPDATVVLVSNGMTHPAQAWAALAARGERRVRVLEDGIEGLKAGLLAPPSLRGPTTAAAARWAWRAYARAHEVLLGRAVPPLPPVAARFATDPERLSEPTVVSTAWVADRRADLVLLDTRDKPEAYAAGHLPGALHLPVKATRDTRGGVADEALVPEKMAEVFGRLGIGPDTEVVAYGDERLQDPTHALLALASLGHRRVAVMEGGLGAWKAQGRPLSTQAPPAPTPKAYAPKAGEDGFWVRLDAVRAASLSGAPAILDVRPADAFRGETDAGEARAGHIPGSIHRAYTEDTASAEGGVWWRPLSELAPEYADLGLLPDRPVIVTCRTGHQASQTWFTLKHLLGYREVLWYDGSWKEWAARPDLPAETGPSRAAGRP